MNVIYNFFVKSGVQDLLIIWSKKKIASVQKTF